ncbi:hypothetical protein SB912_32225, partial [Pantoea sp. SIMBA_072]
MLCRWGISLAAMETGTAIGVLVAGQAGACAAAKQGMFGSNVTGHKSSQSGAVNESWATYFPMPDNSFETTLL